MRFLVSTENKILLFSIFYLFGKIFSLEIKTKIQPNAFSSPFSISSENKNRKQTKPISPDHFLFHLISTPIFFLPLSSFSISSLITSITLSSYLFFFLSFSFPPQFASKWGGHLSLLYQIRINIVTV